MYHELLFRCIRNFTLLGHQETVISVYLLERLEYLAKLDILLSQFPIYIPNYVVYDKRQDVYSPLLVQFSLSMTPWLFQNKIKKKFMKLSSNYCNCDAQKWQITAYEN